MFQKSYKGHIANQTTQQEIMVKQDDDSSKEKDFERINIEETSHR